MPFLTDLKLPDYNISLTIPTAYKEAIQEAINKKYYSLFESYPSEEEKALIEQISEDHQIPYSETLAGDISIGLQELIFTSPWQLASILNEMLSLAVREVMDQEKFHSIMKRSDLEDTLAAIKGTSHGIREESADAHIRNISAYIINERNEEFALEAVGKEEAVEYAEALAAVTNSPSTAELDLAAEFSQSEDSSTSSQASVAARSGASSASYFDESDSGYDSGYASSVAAAAKAPNWSPGKELTDDPIEEFTPSAAAAPAALPAPAFVAAGAIGGFVHSPEAEAMGEEAAPAASISAASRSVSAGGSRSGSQTSDTSAAGGAGAAAVSDGASTKSAKSEIADHAGTQSSQISREAAAAGGAGAPVEKAVVGFHTAAAVAGKKRRGAPPRGAEVYDKENVPPPGKRAYFEEGKVVDTSVVIPGFGRVSLRAQRAREVQLVHLER